MTSLKNTPYLLAFLCDTFGVVVGVVVHLDGVVDDRQSLVNQVGFQAKPLLEGQVLDQILGRHKDGLG